MTTEQKILYTPETAVPCETEPSLPRPREARFQDWEVAGGERLVFEAEEQQYLAYVGPPTGHITDKKRTGWTWQLATPAFFAAACLRVRNKLTGDTYLFCMAPDDSELLSFDNGEVMAALRKIQSYQHIYVVVQTTVHDCTQAFAATGWKPPQPHDIDNIAKQHEIVKACGERESGAYMDTDIRCIRLEHLEIDLLDMSNMAVIKQVYPFPPVGSDDVSSLI